MLPPYILTPISFLCLVYFRDERKIVIQDEWPKSEELDARY